MRILVMGGTGAMGAPLVKILANDSKNTIYVTSRKKRQDKTHNNIQYLEGDAKDEKFFNQIIQQGYDVIVDFMSYNTEEFKRRVTVLLEQTNQYIFISSARCFAESQGLITEDSKRLIDVCDDKEYLATDEYGLAKGRSENILFESSKNNYTIIRPYITYNSYRFQLGVYEKETFLRRAFDQRTILFPKDIAEKRTTLTSGNDVAYLISLLVGNVRAFGQAFNITTNESHTWNEILDMYSGIIYDISGIEIKVKYLDDSSELQRAKNSKYQIIYDRLYNREFDNTKVLSVCGNYSFMKTNDGLYLELRNFYNNPGWRPVNGKFEGWYDHKSGEFTRLSYISGTRNKIQYIKARIIGI